MYAPSRQTPAMVPIFINWTLYNSNGAIPNIGVDVNLSSSSASSPLTIDKIASVSIDNTGSNVPVYVYFPDTQYVIVCGPGQTVIENAVTGGCVAKICGIGFTGGVQPTSLICFYNSVLQPLISGETSFVQPQNFATTPNTLIPNNTPLRPLAVGDLNLSQSTTIYGSTAPTISVGTVTGPAGTKTAFTWPAGFSTLGCYVYITAVQIKIAGLVSRGAGAAAYVGTCTLGFFDTLGSVSLLTDFATNFAAGISSTGVNVEVLSWTGLNIKARCDVSNPFYIGYNAGAFQYFQFAPNYSDVMNLRATVICTLRNENTL